MKKIVSLILALCMLLSLCAVSASADEAVAMSQMQTKDIITIMVNGVYVDCSLYGQLPLIVEGRTLVPLRSVFEALGATVEWDNDTKTVTSTRGETFVSLQVGSSTLVVNGTVKALDVPAQIMNGRTMVPVRAVAEAFGCTVNWDGATRTVIITTEAAQMPDTTVPADTPDKVVEKAYNALVALNFEEAAKYFANEAIMEEFAGVTNYEALIGSYEEMGLSEEQGAMVNSFAENVMTLITYKVMGYTVNGNTAEVTVEISTPDFESIDTESLVTEETVNIILLKVALEKGYTMEDLYYMTEAELAALEGDVVTATIEYIFDTMIEAANNAERLTETETVTLTLKDGKWLIVE